MKGIASVRFFLFFKSMRGYSSERDSMLLEIKKSYLKNKQFLGLLHTYKHTVKKIFLVDGYIISNISAHLLPEVLNYVM